MPENQLDTLVAYLRQHGGRFAIEALRQQMLSEGHDPALVEEAIVVYQREKPAPPARPVWPLALGIAFLNLAVCVAVLGSMAIFDGMLGEMTISVLLLVAAVLILEPVVGAVLMAKGGPLRRPGLGLLLGSLLFFAGLLLLLGGFCLFLMANGY